MQRNSFLILTSAVLILLVSAGSLRSQIRTRVDLVVVPVSVRDNNGFLIQGLEQDDFTVLEDGKPQKIANFSIDLQPLSAAIVVDDAINGNALKRLAPVLPSVAAAFTPNDEMTSFRYDHLVWRLSDFTSDREQIVKSFHELTEIAATRPDEPEPPALYDKIDKKTPAVLRAIAGLFNIGSNGAPSSSVPSAPHPRTPSGSRTMHSAVYEAAMVLQNRSEDHRKIILLLSDGEVSEPQASVIPGKFVHSLDKNVELLLKSEIQVYSISTLAALLGSSSSMLNSYAVATGGDVYGGRSASDMTFALTRILEQARSQYVLGYVSSNTAPPEGVYRKIEVRVGDPTLKRKVTHRKGYFQYPIPK